MNFLINPNNGISDSLNFLSTRATILQNIGSLLTYSRNSVYITDYFESIKLIVTYRLDNEKPLEFILLKPAVIHFAGIDFLSLTFNQAEKEIKKMDAGAKYYEPRTFYTKKFGFGIYAEDERNWKNKLVTSVCVFAEGKI